MRRARAAAAAVSPGRAWRAVARGFCAEFRRLRFQRGCASERASRSRRIPGALPASQTPRGCALVPSSLGHSLLRGLEALSVGPIPARFLLLPVEAPEMSFFISLEMNQVICAGPTDEAGEEGQADSELAHGAGGWGLRVGGAERCGIPGVQDTASRRSRCSLWTRSRRRADPALQALPWLSGRVSGQRRVAGRLGELCGRRSRAGGTRSFGLRGSSRGLGQDLPEGGRGNLRFCCQEPRLVCVCAVSAPGLDSLL